MADTKCFIKSGRGPGRSIRRCSTRRRFRCRNRRPSRRCRQIRRRRWPRVSVTTLRFFASNASERLGQGFQSQFWQTLNSVWERITRNKRPSLFSVSVTIGIPLGLMPFIQMPLGQIPLGQTPLGQMPLGQMPLGQMPLGKMPLGQMPLGKMPLGRQMPLGKMPLGQMSLEQMPLGKMLLELLGWKSKCYDTVTWSSTSEVLIIPDFLESTN